MKAFLRIAVALCVVLTACRQTPNPLLEQLEDELARRPQYEQEKAARIQSLRNALTAPGISAEKQLYLYEELYEQYATYQFDSAMHVVDEAQSLAVSVGDTAASFCCDLHRVMLLATAGYFTELNDLLRSLPTHAYSQELKLEYYKTAEWANVCMADFLDDGRYAQHYWQRGSEWQDSILQLLPPHSVEYRFWKASRQWGTGHADSLIADFRYVYEHVEPQQRLSAQAAYNLSVLYGMQNDARQQRDYLIRAAISDQRAQLKESAALQELALALKHDGGEEARANEYLRLAIDDALFYGNRLRLVKIARKVPTIVMDYDRQLAKANRGQHLVIVAVGVLAVLLAGAIVTLMVSRARLQRERRRIEEAHDDLKLAHEQADNTNQQLNEANTLLREQTRLREGCISLFMELTAAYINKLNAFQLSVQRKVKAHQTADLLKLINPSRMSEQDAREFFLNFDRTFLSTFPDFVDRANALLLPDSQFTLPDAYTLNLDLRILALVRLGVKDSAKIATLLNCSQQTVYNHRSMLKNRAQNKDTFDHDIAAL
ncbi:MAG: hypothetical protein HUK02_08285 [Bacteroidaceae bacterium]|nr:hypothetical protein [Bacteroidaceae bacterium]